MDVFGGAPDSLSFEGLLERRAEADEYHSTLDRFYLTFRRGSLVKTEVWAPTRYIGGKPHWILVEEPFEG